MQLGLNQIEELKSLIREAMLTVYNADYYLIENKVNERAIVFRFGVYFNQQLSRSQFKQFDLDCEYNRNLGEPKRTENFPKGVLPDILLHRRGNNHENILVMEFKGRWNRAGRKRDEQKLLEFTSQDGWYRYALGAFVDIYDYEPIIKYYQNYDGSNPLN